ncbi:MAG: PilZ domain-containing protein [Gammaproteobacteria bacterium]|nr:PilZ domain-containing protein [Gammaproteobacteria bacterium]
MSDDQPIDLSRERREFFRIDDTIALSFQAIPPSSLTKKLERQEKGLESDFTIMSNLAVISQEMSGVLRKIETVAPDIARYLKSLDQKIDLLGKAFLTWTNEMADQPASAVNLSASGMAFNAPEPTEIGTLLELKILLPFFTGLILYAEVVACEKLPTEGDGTGARVYQTRVNFQHLRDRDRDVLIRHVLQRQSEYLRKQRLERED